MKRRALSTVVGAVFFVIVMASTISYVAYSMDLIDNLARSVDVKQDENLNRQNEDFKIKGITIESNNKFNVTLHNSGNIPVKITRLYVENTTDSSWDARKYDVNTEIAPGETKHSVASSLPLYYTNTESYLFNFVTERGNSLKISLSSAGDQPIFTTLHALPDAVPTGFNTVLLYTVINNSTGILANLQPVDPDLELFCTACSSSKNSGPDPATYPALNPGESVTFEWSYEITGDDGDIVNYNTTLVNAYPGVWDEENVQVVEVLRAAESGVSITSAGLGQLSFENDVLVLHEETTGTPSSRYQMYSGAGDGGPDGLIIQLDTVNQASFFTNNSTQTININSGNWNASIRYQSEPMPRSLISSPADLIFHYEDGFNPSAVDNSQGSSNRDLRGGTTCPSDPLFVTTGGPHGSGVYDFESSEQDCFESVNTVTGGDENNIGGYPDSTSLWFKTEGLVTSEQYLAFWQGESGNAWYKISLISPGQVQFQYQTQSGSSLTCTSVNQYDSDGVAGIAGWHHVAVSRDRVGGTAECNLYMDKWKSSGSETITQTTTGGGFSNNVDADGRWVIGANKAQTGNFFDGMIDDVMHWDGYKMTSTTATELAKTSYGIDAHKINFKMDRTGQTGTFEASLVNNLNIKIPFYDTKGAGDNDDSAYSIFNNTLAMPNLNLASGKRLNFTMSWVPANSTWVPLDIDIKIDDETITPYTSLLQIHEIPANPFPSYTVFDNDSDMRFNFKNAGPNGIYFTYAGTRLVLNSTSSGVAYAGIPHYANGTTPSQIFTPDQDSMFYGPNTVGWIDFYPPRTTPSFSPANGILVPAGVYDASVFVFGYDNEGESFDKRFDLGVVTVKE